MRHGILIEQYNDSDCPDVLTIPYDNSGPRMGVHVYWCKIHGVVPFLCIIFELGRPAVHKKDMICALEWV
jgi:hypothetical protein